MVPGNAHCPVVPSKNAWCSVGTPSDHCPLVPAIHCTVLPIRMLTDACCLMVPNAVHCPVVPGRDAWSLLVPAALHHCALVPFGARCLLLLTTQCLLVHICFWNPQIFWKQKNPKWLYLSFRRKICNPWSSCTLFGTK